MEDTKKIECKGANTAMLWQAVPESAMLIDSA
jgi:hypothetical protein